MKQLALQQMQHHGPGPELLRGGAEALKAHLRLRLAEAPAAPAPPRMEGGQLELVDRGLEGPWRRHESNLGGEWRRSGVCLGVWNVL